MTYRALIDDILKSSGEIVDDSFRNRMAVAQNVFAAINRLKYQRIQKDIRMTGDRGTSGFATTYASIPVQYEASLNDRAYFDVPGSVFNLQQNGGVSYICYARDGGCADNLVGKHFTLATPSEIDILNGSAFQKPRPAMPYYMAAAFNDGEQTYTNRIWLFGISPQVEAVEAGLYLATGDLTNTDLDSEMNLPDDMVLLVKYQVLNLERWCFYVPQEKLRNEGRDTPVGANQGTPPQMASVNSPLLNADQ